jgi:ribosomal protein L37AE/L43A
MAQRRRVTYALPDGSVTFKKPKKLLTKKQAKKAYAGLVKRLAENKKRHMVEGWGEQREKKGLVYCPRCGAVVKGERVTDGSLALGMYIWECSRCGWRSSGSEDSPYQEEPINFKPEQKEEKPLWRGWAFKKVADIPLLSKKTPANDISKWSKVKMVRDGD